MSLLRRFVQHVTVGDFPSSFSSFCWVKYSKIKQSTNQSYTPTFWNLCFYPYSTTIKVRICCHWFPRWGGRFFTCEGDPSSSEGSLVGLWLSLFEGCCGGFLRGKGLLWYFWQHKNLKGRGCVSQVWQDDKFWLVEHDQIPAISHDSLMLQENPCVP